MPDGRHGGYLPIENYGAIGNLQTVSLVGLNGSVDWCCFPELNRASVFAALLDHRKGGRFRVAPSEYRHSHQRYLERTNVLETRFEADGGWLSLTDFMPLRGSIVGASKPAAPPEIHRILRCEGGRVHVEVEWSPRFDYARASTRIMAAGEGFLASAGTERLVLGGLPSGGEIHDGEYGSILRARFTLHAGEQVALVTRYGADDASCTIEQCLGSLQETTDVWRAWAHVCVEEECAFAGPCHPQVVRSGLVLKLLTHPHTGAIAAAPTTSLPEEIGGARNWDYRYTWIRDAAFTAQALFSLGHRAEALEFLQWAQRVSMVKGDRPFGLQIMYGLHGETELPEIEMEHLEGYQGSRPVRTGNAAAKQRQLDIYGELLGSAYELVRLGGTLDPPLMAFLSAVAERACMAWREPDYGIWEERGGPRHFVYSKVMCWVALDRAVRLAERHGLPGRVGMWRREREAIRRAVLSEGFDAKLDAFVQSFGSATLDAANLLIPVVEFLPFDDPRVQSTIDRTLGRLTVDGLVYRYLTDDGLPGGEGAFGLATFWMVDALTLSGPVEEAREMFFAMADRANHLELYSEELDPRTGAFLGNFPQAFTHIGFINSAIYLSRAEGRLAPAPAPIGSREHAREAGHETGASA